MRYREINFDGLVGPTHNYAGLAWGNLASCANKAQASNPRAAALQGLDKAMALARRGHLQGILPPHERPAIAVLRAWGFGGRDEAAVLARAARAAPQLLAAASSASAMWAANAATMTPSCDAADSRAHFTPANLNGNLHRSLEAPFNQRLLEALFGGSDRFAVHAPLPGGAAMADEGAANHTRLCLDHGGPAVHLFVYGRAAAGGALTRPARFPARQTLEAAQAVARLHGIAADRAVFLQQAPAAIDAGVFHNDVIATGHRDVFLFHEAAYAGGREAVAELARRFAQVAGRPLRLVRVSAEQVSLAEAVRTYLFNSQLLDRPEGGLLMVVPAECREEGPVARLLDQWVADPDHPVAEVQPFNLRESMRNGGGPACLRLRVVLNDHELAHLQGRVLLDEALHADLTAWVRRHYRDHLVPEDLADPSLHEESHRALDELTRILHLPGLYPFQG